MKQITLALILFYYSVTTSAQQFGGFPPTTRWKQINTDTARIIFDPASGGQAQRIATILHDMAGESPNMIGRDLKKINIVLHKNTTLANGYVALAPFRSEFYLIPSSNVFELGNLPWNEHLAIHEYRHVQQYNNFNHGLAKAFRFVLGQEGQALANSLTIPNWFFEGDAVHSETALSPQGRGRLPLFLSGYNSLWRDDKKYSLMKLLNGSIKDYVPNHYQLGYLVVNYGYEKYGPGFWGKVTRDASAFRGLVYPFRQAIEKYSGTRYRKFIFDALDHYKKKIKVEPKTGRDSKTVTNHYFPAIIGADSLLYLKDGYNSLPAFYIKDKNGEHKIKLRNISAEDWYSYNKGIIAYTAYDANARWSLTDYSDIVLLDITTGKERKLTREKKYFTPDIAPSGKTIVSVFINDSTGTELHLIDSESGSVFRKINAKAGDFFMHPRFIDEQSMVVSIRRLDGSIALHRISIGDGHTEPLTPSSFDVIGYPSIQNDTVYFTAAFGPNDELYAMPLKNKKIFQLTEEQTGNYYVQAHGNNMVWSAFTADGLQLKSKAKDQMLWKEVDTSTLSKRAMLYPVAPPVTNILAAPARNFEESTYKKSTGLFNFHSWRPYYVDPEFTFSLYGDNVLSTFSNELFYRFNQNELSHTLGFNTSYAGLFPVLTAGAEYTFNRNVRVNRQGTVVDALFNNYELQGGYYIPLNFSGGNTYKYLTFGSNYVLNQTLPVQDTKRLFGSFYNTYLHHYLSWSQQLPRAVQHIYTKLGYRLSAEHRHRLDDAGYQLLGNASLFLPSPGNHSLVLSGSVQQADTGNVLFSNRFANSRGYAATDSSRMWRASANYHFPLFYPDRGFGGIVYFQRIRANLFYDLTRVYSGSKTKSFDLRSAGTELFFDTKWWNQMPVSFGIRYSRLLDAAHTRSINKNVWEIIIPNLIQ